MSDESTLNEGNGELPRFPPPKIKDYQLIKLIGEGSFGQVWLAMDATDSPCALKIIYKEKTKKDLFWKEFEGVKNYLPISPTSSLSFLVIIILSIICFMVFLDGSGKCALYHSISSWL